MFLSWLCTSLLLLSGLLLIFIVLLQRGRGGGLAGAFGGAGGHSAFGTKAGDVFTKITIVMAVIWVVMAGVTGYAMRHDSQKAAGIGDTAPETPGGTVTKDPAAPKTPKTKTPSEKTPLKTGE